MCLCLQPCKAAWSREILNNKTEILNPLNKISSDVLGQGERGKKGTFFNFQLNSPPLPLREGESVKIFLLCKNNSGLNYWSKPVERTVNNPTVGSYIQMVLAPTSLYSGGHLCICIYLTRKKKKKKD